MLRTMRSGAKHWAMGILFGVLILSFAVWGIGDIFTGGTAGSSVGEVGGEEIPAEEFRTLYQRQVADLTRQLGAQVDQDFIARLGIGPQVANRIAERMMFDIAARDLNLAVPDAVVAGYIRTQPAFTSLGSFSQTQYEAILRAQGMSPGYYESRVRADLRRSQLIDTILAPQIAPKALTDALVKFSSEVRKADMVEILTRDAKVGEPTDKQLEEFHTKYARRFSTPELRSIIAIVLDPDEMMKSIDVPEEKLKEAYEQQKAAFQTPERRSLAQMLFKSEADAKAAYGELKGGKDWGEAAKTKTNLQGVKTGLGTFAKGQVPIKELAEPAFKPEKGGFSEPVKSALGWHIVRVVDLEPARVTGFEDAKPKLLAAIRKQEAGEMVTELSIKVEDELAGGAPYAEVGKKLNVKVLELAGVSRRGQDASGKAIAGLPKDPVFLREAFTTEEGAETPFKEFTAGGAFIIKVRQIEKPKVRPLKDIRAEVVGSWKATQKLDAARKQADELIQKTKKEGKSLKELAEAAGLEVKSSEAFDRRSVDAGIKMPRPLVVSLFDAKKGEAKATPTADSVVIAQVTEITAGEAGKVAKTRETIEKALKTAFATDLLAQYADDLRRRYTIEIDEAAIKYITNPRPYDQQ